MVVGESFNRGLLTWGKISTLSIEPGRIGDGERKPRIPYRSGSTGSGFNSCIIGRSIAGIKPRPESTWCPGDLVVKQWKIPVRQYCRTPLQ